MIRKKSIEKIRDDLYIAGKPGNYRVVYPFKKDIDAPLSADNINWKNFLLGGSWARLGKVLFLVGFIWLIAFAYVHDNAECLKNVEEPCRHCLTDRCTINNTAAEGTYAYDPQLQMQQEGFPTLTKLNVN